MVSQSGHQGVRALPSGHIQIYFKYEGRLYQKVIKSPATPNNLVAASRERKRLKARVEAGLPFEELDLSNPLVGHVAQDWLDLCRNRSPRPLAARTIEGYKQMLNQYWLPEISRIPVRELRYAHLKAIDDAIRWGHEKTRKNAHVPLRGLCEHIESGDLTDYRLYKFARIRPVRENNEAYTLEERDQILDWLKQNAPPVPYMYFRTAFGTGMRSGELLALSWSSYDGRGFLVSEAISRGEIKDTKTHRSRYVPIGNSLRKELETFRASQVERWGMEYHRGALFLNQYGRAYKRSDKLNTWLHQACQKTGVRKLGGKHDPYPWRHTFITLAIENSLEAGTPVDLITLADTTGHSVQVMEKVYREVRQRTNYDHHLGNIGDL